MALVSNPKSGDDVSVRQAIARLGSTKLGPTSTPTFGSITTTTLTVSGLTTNSLIYPVAGLLTSLGTAIDGQLPIGDTGGVPILATLTGTANEIDITNAAGSITIGLVNPLIVAKGGTGTATLTDHGILLGSGTSAVTPLGVASNGQLPIGSAGADPVLATLTGTTDHISVTNGAGSVTLDLATNTQTLLGSFNGIFLEKLDFTISEAAGTVTGSLEQDGGGDLIQKFSDGYTTLDCTPALTINLTAYVGTNAVPKETFVYILQSAKTVMAASNSDWPVTEHCKIARLVLKSATTTGTDGGALGNQNINDYAVAPNGEGHLAHVEQRLRQEPAAYDEGVALTLKNAAGAGLTTGNSSTAVEIVTTEGKVYQLHRHTFPAFDMYTTATDDAHIVNQPTDEGGAYKTTAALVTDVTHYVDGTAAGVVIGTNKYFNLVVWGIQNRSGETSHIMINLPTGQYTTSANAVADVDGISIFEIPSVFKDIGFLIARLTFRLIGGSQWTYIAQEDLRGKFPDIIAGVGITTTDHALLANLIAPADDHTQYLLADGTRALAGAWDMGNQALTNVNIDSGDINVAVVNTEWDAAYSHSQVTHDYAYISGNDGATDVSAAELEELTDSSATTLHSHAGGADVKVGIDVGATADYLGAANNDGALRTDGSNITYTDGGNFVTLTTAQGIQTSSTPQFARMGLGAAAHASVPLHISDGNAVNAALITSVYGLISAYDTAPGFSIVSAGPDSTDRAVFQGVRSNGTLASPTVPALNDLVLSFLGSIYDGTDTEGTAAIDFIVDGTVSSNVAPQRVSICTSETNSASRLERLTVKNTGCVGINTTTAPHGGIGSARLAIDGPVSSVGVTHATTGPHVQFTVHGDDYPVLQLLNYAHDNISLNFDSYFDGAWKSSDAGSSFQIIKTIDTLRFKYDVAAVGGAITWNDGIIMNNAGVVQINGTLSSGVITQSGTTLANTYHPKTTVGIADNNLVEMDDADAADNDYAKFTANGLEGRSYAEVLGDLSAQATAAFDLNGQDLTNGGVLFLTEQAAAEANIAGKGQFWVKTATPNEPWFDNDAGTEIPLDNRFVDRGDPATSDYEVGDLTTDETYRDLDLGPGGAGIVPVNTVAVLLSVKLQDDDAAGSFVIFRKNGNSNQIATATLRTQVAGIGNDNTVTIPCDSSGIIEYNAANVTWTVIRITVLGWWLA